MSRNSDNDVGFEKFKKNKKRKSVSEHTSKPKGFKNGRRKKREQKENW